LIINQDSVLSPTAKMDAIPSEDGQARPRSYALIMFACLDASLLSEIGFWEFDDFRIYGKRYL